MAENDEDGVPWSPVHRGLERRVMIKGGERELVMLVLLFGFIVGLVDSVAFGPWFGIPLGIAVSTIGHWVAREMGKADSRMMKVASRSVRYRKSYSARGRPQAKVPAARGFL